MLTQFNVERSKKLWVSNGFTTVRGLEEELRRCIVSLGLMFFLTCVEIKRVRTVQLS